MKDQKIKEEVDNILKLLNQAVTCLERGQEDEALRGAKATIQKLIQLLDQVDRTTLSSYKVDPLTKKLVLSLSERVGKVAG